MVASNFERRDPAGDGREGDYELARLRAWSEGHELLCEERQLNLMNMIKNVDMKIDKVERWVLTAVVGTFGTMVIVVGFLLRPYFS